MQNEKKLQLNDSYYTVCANALIKATQRMTLREMQLLQIAISQICKSDTEFYTYTTTAVELAKFLGVSRQSIYKDYADITTRLLKNIITIDYEDKIKQFQWLSYADYDKANHTITIQLHERLKPFLLGLNKLYTQIDLNTILKFKSYYSLRLYQLIVSEYGATKKTTFKMTVKEVREFFGVDKDKYDRTFNLLKKTLSVAIDEINSLDLCTIKNYEMIKESRAVGAVSFNVKWDM